jgi:leader peptidase (prepilin peptidase) / N-methyltransferase
MIQIIGILLGLAAGSLINYLADVLPTQHALTRPVCAQCGATFEWQDYFLINACKKCRAPRAWRTYFTILAALGIAVLLVYFPPQRLGTWLGMLLAAYFGLVIIIDLEHRLILHIISLAGAILGLVTGTLTHGLVNTLLGGVGGFGVMLVFYLFGLLFARYRARKLGLDDDEEALGFGDVTISGVLGLMLGWPWILAGLVIGILLGGLISLLIVIILVAARRFQSMNVFTAYGPYLVLGATLVLFFPKFLALILGQ